MKSFKLSTWNKLLPDFLSLEFQEVLGPNMHTFGGPIRPINCLHFESKNWASRVILQIRLHVNGWLMRRTASHVILYEATQSKLLVRLLQYQGTCSPQHQEKRDLYQRHHRLGSQRWFDVSISGLPYHNRRQYEKECWNAKGSSIVKCLVKNLRVACR